MKKYIVFLYEWYEAKGGMNDFSKSFNTLQNAINYTMEQVESVKCFTPDVGHVVDRDTWEVVFRSNDEPGEAA